MSHHTYDYFIIKEGGLKVLMDKIAVLIPCYNEAKTIKKVIEDYKKVLPEAVIYVYDNNSTDSTDKIARQAGAVVRYEYQQGKGNVIRRMFREIDADCYIMTDGDDTYPAESAREMVELVLKQKVDMVVGDRLSSTARPEVPLFIQRRCAGILGIRLWQAGKEKYQRHEKMSL